MTECYEEQLRKLGIVISHLESKIEELKNETELKFRSSGQNEKIVKYTVELNNCKKAFIILSHRSKENPSPCPIHSTVEPVDEINLGVM